MSAPTPSIVARTISLAAALLCLTASSFALAKPHPDHDEHKRTSSKEAKGHTKASRKASDQPPKNPKPVAGAIGKDVNYHHREDVSAFVSEMVAKHGMQRKTLELIFSDTRMVESAIQLVKPAPPGKPKNWKAYRARFIDPVRINAGAAFWNKHAEALERAEAHYGVPAEIIVGIIGVETVYGRNTGNFRVMDALTTLAFDYPSTPNRADRMKFFRGEVENTLLLARDTGIDPFSILGSYAGAVGWPQFMPGSIRQYGVDFDGDGKIDLRQSPVDAIGSVANFLVQHGWKRGLPIVFPAGVSAADYAYAPILQNQGLEAKYAPQELEAAGVIFTEEPPANMPFGLVDLQNGYEATEYWVGTPNFFAICHYNRSFFYAMSVVDLGRAVREKRAGQVGENAQ